MDYCCDYVVVAGIITDDAAVNNINLAAASLSQTDIEIYRKQRNFDEVESEKEREKERIQFSCYK